MTIIIYCACLTKQRMSNVYQKNFRVQHIYVFTPNFADCSSVKSHQKAFLTPSANFEIYQKPVLQVSNFVVASSSQWTLMMLLGWIVMVFRSILPSVGYPKTGSSGDWILKTRDKNCPPDLLWRWALHCPQLIFSTMAPQLFRLIFAVGGVGLNWTGGWEQVCSQIVDRDRSEKQWDSE